MKNRYLVLGLIKTMFFIHIYSFSDKSEIISDIYKEMNITTRVRAFMLGLTKRSITTFVVINSKVTD
jgi:hypothetical protein